jgi:methionine synthase I (cobalamin-dependent)
MKTLLQEMIVHGPVVTDGAWGTQLQARGLPVGECPERWNLLRAECVEEVARAYVEAGSQVILTNTFGGNTFALARNGLEARTAEINRKGVEISKRAASGRARVFASMGPTGQLLAMGDVPAERVGEAFREQAEALAEGGAEALVVETMSDLAEARLAVAAARATGLPVIACMTYGAGRTGDRTIMGVTPEQAVDVLTAAGADGIGTNCGEGAQAVLALCRRMRAVTCLPLWIKPNAGRPQLIEGRAVYNAVSPEAFAAQMVAMVRAGADFVGGCCGTSPAFIRALVHALQGEAR